MEVPNTTVYIEDGAEIDLTGVTLCLAEGVTLAGGRGRNVDNHSPGALLYTTDIAENAHIVTCGDDVRITGAFFCVSPG